MAVVPTWVGYSAATTDWLGTPQDIENEFRKYANSPDGAVTPQYIQDFERLLHKVHSAVAGRAPWTLCKGEVMTVLVRTFPMHIVIEVVITRPCAMGLGFFRVLLFELMRSAFCHNLALHIDCPTAETVNIFRRAGLFHPILTLPQEVAISGGLPKGSPTKRLILTQSEMGSAYLALGIERDHLILPLAETGSDFLQAPILLNAAAFPTADELNRGRTAASDARIRSVRQSSF
jgi:hypothetical protein